MGRWKLWVGAVLAVSQLSVAAPGRGLCQQDHSVPGLPKAICSFPSCPTGGDCMPPAIEKSNPSIEYFEPLIRWQDSCPTADISGSCWEVYIDFRLKLGAQDPSGVSHIGVHMVYEVNAQRIFKRYWGAAVTKDSSARYDMTGAMVVHVPPGQRLEMGVYELCARDRNGNEGCVLPAKARDLQWNGEMKVGKK